MNKQLSLKRLLAATLLIGAVALASCAAAPAAVISAPAPAQAAQQVNTTSAIANVDDGGNTSVDLAALSSTLSQASTGQLTSTEADGLRFMREEEKLAHDVYVALYEKWGLRIFNNISNSEQTHTDAVKTLLDRYGVADPAAGKPPASLPTPRSRTCTTSWSSKAASRWRMPCAWARRLKKLIFSTWRSASPRPTRPTSGWSMTT